MADRYWLSTPGSKDPPRGPMDISTVQASWNTGNLDPGTTMCKVGDATWVTIQSVFGDPKKQAPPLLEPLPAPGSFLRAALEARYSNLASVASSLSLYGGILKVLAFLLIGGGVLGVAVGVTSGAWIAAVSILVFIIGIGIWALGLLIAALGEGLLALKDIAVSTRLTSEK